MRALGLFGAALALGLGVVGCGGPEYERMDLQGQPSDLGGEVTKGRIAVPVGLVVKAHIVVWNDDDEQMTLTLRSKDPKVVEVANVVNANDYAFIGKAAGQTSIEFQAGDTVVLTVDAVVTAQPTAP